MRNIEGLPDDPAKLGIEFASAENLERIDRVEKLKEGAKMIVGMETYQPLISKIESLLDVYKTANFIPEEEFVALQETGDLSEVDMGFAIATVLQEKKNIVN